MIFFFAPVQGHTDAAYRHFHTRLYGNNLTYVTPFIRLEKNELRPRDLRDYKSDLNSNLHVIPQIIFRNREELLRLTELMMEADAKEIDLNMGCPFPLQTGHGRGAATIGNIDLAENIKNLADNNPEISFSVKMRLGMKDPSEWRKIMPVLNEARLSHIVMHPRVAAIQYNGQPDLEEFAKFHEESKNPVIYNGDLTSPSEIASIIGQFPGLKGIMIGRGLLRRPSLIQEFISGTELNPEERIKKMLEFHNELYQYYASVLCGDSQVISKIQPFWEYAEEEIGRKSWKAIKKASSLAKYQTAIATIHNSLI